MQSTELQSRLGELRNRFSEGGVHASEKLSDSSMPQMTNDFLLPAVPLKTSLIMDAVATMSP